MPRQTIADLAKAAGVSVATVNRVLAGGTSVRKVTVQRVLQAAEQIGFYGTNTIRERAVTARRRFTFAFLLQQPGRPFYVALENAIRAEAATRDYAVIDLRIEYLKDLSPEFIASRMRDLGADADALAVITAQHPLIANAIESLAADGVPTISFVSQLTTGCGVHYVGLDNWKVGRTAAWAIDRLCKRPGKIGIFVGNHRYRSQDLNESGFRSYFREFAPNYTLLEPFSTYESATIAREVLESVLNAHPDLVGIYLAGGGITGSIAALRAHPGKEDLIRVGHEFMLETREALVDETLTFVIAHPMKQLVAELISAMCQVREAGSSAVGEMNRILPFDIHIRENL